MAACCVAAYVGGFATAISGSGGLVTIPVYLTVNIPPFVVLGTNKATLAMGLTQSSYKYSRENMVQWNVLRKWALPTMFLSGGAAYGIRFMSDQTWTVLVAIIVLVAAIASYPKRRKTGEREFVSYFPPFYASLPANSGLSLRWRCWPCRRCLSLPFPVTYPGKIRKYDRALGFGNLPSLYTFAAR